MVLSEKISESVLGESVLGRSPKKSVLTKHWMNRALTSREKVLKVLKEADHRMSVSEIARKANLSWVTTRNALKDLMLLGKVKGVRHEEGRGQPLLFKLKA